MLTNNTLLATVSVWVPCQVGKAWLYLSKAYQNHSRGGKRRREQGQERGSAVPILPVHARVLLAVQRLPRRLPGGCRRADVGGGALWRQ